MLQEVKVDPSKVKGETEISSRLIQIIKKNQVKILDLNDTISFKKIITAEIGIGTIVISTLQMRF